MIHSTTPSKSWLWFLYLILDLNFLLGGFFILSDFFDEQEVTARIFMPLFECPSKRCKTNNTKGNLILQLRASKFLKFQEVTVDFVNSMIE